MIERRKGGPLGPMPVVVTGPVDDDDGPTEDELVAENERLAALLVKHGVRLEDLK